MTSWSAAQWLLAMNAIDTLGTIVLAITLLWLRSMFPTRRQHEALEKRIQGHSDRLSAGDGRMTVIEQRLASMPTANGIMDLAVSIERLSGDMRALSMKIEGMEGLHKTLERQVGVMDDWLRSEGRR